MFWRLYSAMHHSQWKKPYSRVKSSLNLESKRITHSSLGALRRTEEWRAAAPLKGAVVRVSRVDLLCGLGFEGFGFRVWDGRFSRFRVNSRGRDGQGCFCTLRGSQTSASRQAVQGRCFLIRFSNPKDPNLQFQPTKPETRSHRQRFCSQ